MTIKTQNQLILVIKLAILDVQTPTRKQTFIPICAAVAEMLQHAPVFYWFWSVNEVNSYPIEP